MLKIKYSHKQSTKTVVVVCKVCRKPLHKETVGGAQVHAGCQK